MNRKFLALSTAAVATVIALAGCGTGPGGTSMPGMDHGSSAGTAAPAGTPAAAADHNGADILFARMMIPHHAQAVRMSDMMLTKQGIPAPVTALATRIKAAQGPEIEKMTAWLTSWNEPALMPSGPAMDGGMDHGMAGMMSEEDLKKLDAAEGTDAAKLFLAQMIAHHEGAVKMASTESTAGTNPAAVQLSKDIVASQEAEIREMKDLLAAL